MKLWKVTLTIDFAMASEQEPDRTAMLEAGKNAAADCDGTVDLYAVEITSADNLPDDWHEECLPYGNSGGRNCGDILNGAKEPS